ncbi:uncharacterized protein [Cicer arietinum]|uniref:Leucine-rich repeat-containing protein DDB_G0290503 isoform X2 n=1 Tax=Cicer arietinum TaxID=3827 RepID=A0A3Q7XZ51_CICAR|nr:putative leucine-rich repeat-containing protein DDB_G0290503 isoform X2 [Cicer arietinum]
MGNEMGNNNTSAIKEEDNISEADKKNLLEDTSELANEISQDVYEDCVKEENHNIPISLAKDVMEKDSNTSSDITIELGKDIAQEDGHEDDSKEKIQTILIDEANDADEKAALFDSKNNTTNMLESDSLDDTYASDINMENEMHTKAEEEDVGENVTELASEDATTELGKVSQQEESRGDDAKVETQMIPEDEAKDVEEKDTGLISHDIESKLENDSLEGVTHERDMNMENQMHQTNEAEDVEEKATISSLKSDLLKGKDDQEVAAGLDYDDKKSELEVEDKSQEEKQDENMIIPFTNDIDDQGNTTILAFYDPLNLRNSFVGEGEEMNGVAQPEKSPHAESVEGENCESLSSSSLEGSEECVKQEKSCLRKNPSLTYNHYLNYESSIKPEFKESPSVHHDEVVKFISEDSLEVNESPLKETLPDGDSDVSEKDIESQEIFLCENSNENLLTKVNYTTEDSLNSNHEENKLSRSESTNESSDKVEETENGFLFDAYVNNSINVSAENSDALQEKNSVVHEVEADEEETSVLTSNDSEFQELPSVNHDEVVNVFLSEHSIQVNESFLKDTLPEADSHFQQINHDVSEKDKESQEKMLCENNNENLLTNVNYTTTEDSLNSNHEENFKVLNEENKLSESTNESSDQVEESKVTESENEFLNNFINVSDENNDALEEKNSFVSEIPEVEAVFLIAGTNVIECIHEKEKNHHSNQIEDTNENLESSYVMIKKIEEESFSLNSDSNNSIFANGGYETRFSTESNPDNSRISCMMQKSPSFNLDLCIEAGREELDQIPLLYESDNDNLFNKKSLNLRNSMPHDEYESDHIDQCLLQSVEMQVEEKIVTMERSYSEISKGEFIGLLKEEEEAHLLVMAETQDNNDGSKMEVKEESSSSPKGNEKRKYRSYFFTSCICCATLPN